MKLGFPQETDFNENFLCELHHEEKYCSVFVISCEAPATDVSIFPLTSSAKFLGKSV